MTEKPEKAGLIETHPLLPVGMGFAGLAVALFAAAFFCEEPYKTTKAAMDCFGGVVMAVLGLLCVRFKGLKGEGE